MSCPTKLNSKPPRQAAANASVAQLDRVSPSDGEGCGFDSRRVYQKTALCFCISLFFIYSAPTSTRRAALPSQRSGDVSRRKKQKLRSEIISGGSKPPPYIAIQHAQRLTVFQIISRKGFLILTAKAPSHLDNGRQPTLSPKYRPRSNLIFCTTLQTFLTTEKSSPTDIAKASVSIFRVRPLSAICFCRRSIFRFSIFPKFLYRFYSYLNNIKYYLKLLDN